MTDADYSTNGAYVTGGAEFTRDTNYITTRITRDGRDGYPVEPGRYRLIAARACPWANRTIIVRRLLGLEDVISMGLCGPTHDERSAGPSTSIPAASTRCWATSGCSRPTSPASRTTRAGITVPAVVDVADQGGRHQRLSRR